MCLLLSQEAILPKYLTLIMDKIKCLQRLLRGNRISQVICNGSTLPPAFVSSRVEMRDGRYTRFVGVQCQQQQHAQQLCLFSRRWIGHFTALRQRVKHRLFKHSGRYKLAYLFGPVSHSSTCLFFWLHPRCVTCCCSCYLTFAKRNDNKESKGISGGAKVLGGEKKNSYIQTRT